MTKLNKYIGNRAFYKTVLAVLLPITAQNAISNFVSLLDNLMVGRVGTEQMSGVAISNQLCFIYYLCIFGGMAGAGIFTAQFFGAGNHDGVKQTFRAKFYLGIALTAIGIIVFSLFPSQLITLYLTEDSNGGDLALTLKYGMDYMRIAIWGFIPFFITQAYASTLRECGKTVLPMKASIAAVLTNLVLNYLLIYGKLGFPALGVEGAAIATLISRLVEVCTVVLAVQWKKSVYPFMVGIFKRLGIDRALVKSIIAKGLPLLMNEFLWSLGMAVLLQVYSLRGLAVVGGLNISYTVSNLFNVVCMSMGNAVAIIVGQALGAKDVDAAKDGARKLIALNVVIGIVMGLVMLVCAPYIPLLYNTGDAVRDLAAVFLRISALCMPIFAFLHTCYFTLRSGGKTFITFLFDSAFVWAVSYPLACLLVYTTPLDIAVVFLICQLADLIKCAIGFILLKKGIWVQNIVGGKTEPKHSEIAKCEI